MTSVRAANSIRSVVLAALTVIMASDLILIILLTHPYAELVERSRRKVRMRRTTRDKLYAKGAAGGALHSAINELRAAIVEAGKPQPHTPLYDALQGAAAALKRAADSFDTYNLKKKRLQKAIKKELARIEELLQELQGTPITKEEKLVAKTKKKGKEV